MLTTRKMYGRRDRETRWESLHSFCHRMEGCQHINWHMLLEIAGCEEIWTPSAAGKAFVNVDETRTVTLQKFKMVSFHTKEDQRAHSGIDSNNVCFGLYKITLTDFPPIDHTHSGAAQCRTTWDGRALRWEYMSHTCFQYYFLCWQLVKIFNGKSLFGRCCLIFDYQGLWMSAN